MKINGNVVFSYKELAYRWGLNKWTVPDEVKRFKMKACHFIGRQPFFSEREVVKLEKRRLLKRSREIGLI